MVMVAALMLFSQYCCFLMLATPRVNHGVGLQVPESTGIRQQDGNSLHQKNDSHMVEEVMVDYLLLKQWNYYSESVRCIHTHQVVLEG